MHASSHANPMPIFLCGRMFDFNTSIAYNIEEKSQSCISIMALKRKCNNDLRIVLDYATGDRVRATCTRDARNKREIYTINFYSGYPDDDLPTLAFVSGPHQLHVTISDCQFLQSGLDASIFTHRRITETIERKFACRIYISYSIILSP